MTYPIVKIFGWEEKFYLLQIKLDKQICVVRDLKTKNTHTAKINDLTLIKSGACGVIG